MVYRLITERDLYFECPEAQWIIGPVDAERPLYSCAVYREPRGLQVTFATLRPEPTRGWDSRDFLPADAVAVLVGHLNEWLTASMKRSQ